MKRKTIGVPGYRNTNSDSFGVGIAYMEFLSKFGDVRILMPQEEFVKVDLLFLPGGADLTPSTYGEIPGYRTQNHDVFKEFFYHNRLDAYINRGVPVFGVCLGYQMLAAKFGSKLTQDFIFHAQSDKRTDEAHKVYLRLNEYGLPDEKFKKGIFEVNSFHHQGVTLENLGEDLIPLAFAENEDAYLTGHNVIVEAFKHRTLKISGVQWHPENIYDGYSRHLINELLKDENSSQEAASKKTTEQVTA